MYVLFLAMFLISGAPLLPHAGKVWVTPITPYLAQVWALFGLSAYAPLIQGVCLALLGGVAWLMAAPAWSRVRGRFREGFRDDADNPFGNRDIAP